MSLSTSQKRKSRAPLRRSDASSVLMENSSSWAQIVCGRNLTTTFYAGQLRVADDVGQVTNISGYRRKGRCETSSRIGRTPQSVYPRSRVSGLSCLELIGSSRSSVTHDESRTRQNTDGCIIVNRARQAHPRCDGGRRPVWTGVQRIAGILPSLCRTRQAAFPISRSLKFVGFGTICLYHSRNVTRVLRSASTSKLP